MFVVANVATAFKLATTPLTFLSAKNWKNSSLENACENFFLIMNFFGDVSVKKSIDFGISQKQMFHEMKV